MKVQEHSEFRVKHYFLPRTVAIHSPIHMPKFERLPRKKFIVSGLLFIITHRLYFV